MRRSRQQNSVYQGGDVLSRIGVITSLFLLILCWSVGGISVSAAAEERGAAVIDQDEKQQLLDLFGYKLWQRINEIRDNPIAEIQALGLDPDQVAAVLGDDAWVLDRGLPPLAWNASLAGAARLHGRDMLTNIYYSHTSQDGRTPFDRIVAAGYNPLREGESLGVLLFSRFVNVNVAPDVMIDIILRDELTGVSGVQRNIFSPDMTEVGVSFFAESIELLEGQPYVYLLVLDFAAPVEPRYYICGAFDSGSSLAIEGSYTGFWEPVLPLSEGYFQVLYPNGGATLTAYDSDGQVVASQTVYEADPTHNHYLDLRGNLAGR